jgi:hypothetical protein
LNADVQYITTTALHDGNALIAWYDPDGAFMIVDSEGQTVKARTE